MKNKLEKQYIHDQILNASPGQLIVLLYDGAIKALEVSKKEVDNKDPHDFSKNITKAESIISELLGALKKEVFPELVENLARLYDFMYSQLIDAHKEKDVARIDNVITLLKGLKESWGQALESAAEKASDTTTEQSVKKEEAPKVKPKPALSFQA
jgi:flagellar secretion chaperone FliS